MTSGDYAPAVRASAVPQVVRVQSLKADLAAMR